MIRFFFTQYSPIFPQSADTPQLSNEESDDEMLVRMEMSFRFFLSKLLRMKS